MTNRLACICAILLSTTAPAPGQTNQDSNAKTTSGARPSAAIQQPVDLKSDLQKMRVLIEQMQRNVAFVSAGDTPLKHQFQLEIEMWQLLLRDMDRKIDESGMATR
ncbi:MAG TPA: hypothetical protein VFU50_19075 [Terriglobales bacterium]|nr:hypothetical protein [Terriglobales bacterium]